MNTPEALPFHVAPMTLPPLTETALPNGLSVVTVERHDLPLVTVRLVIGTGSARDPLGKDGLAAFTADLLRRGTARRSADQIDDAIESVGGLLGVDAGLEATGLTATVPSDHAAGALEVIADLAQRASFPEPEVELARRRTLALLAQLLDEPSSVADRALVDIFYGKDHAYGHPGDGRASTVETFRREDAAAFRDATYRPAGALLLFAGDIRPEEAVQLARNAFGEWEGEPLASSSPAAAARPRGLDVLLVDKADATQAQVRLAVPGIARKDVRFYAAVLANAVVGGGFTSRLVDEVRVNRGLSYSVGTRLVALRELGAVTLATFTKSETAREILDVSLGVLDAFRAEGPTAQELDKARRYVIGLYPERVESNEQLAEALSSARFLGLPFDVVARYRDELARATLPEVVEMARLFPGSDGAKVVVVGRAGEIAAQLEGLGAVTVRKVDDFR